MSPIWGVVTVKETGHVHVTEVLDLKDAEVLLRKKDIDFTIEAETKQEVLEQNPCPVCQAARERK